MTSNRSAFADHFSAQATEYARHRPRYPAELFAWLAGQCQQHELAWDVGCGNGQASLALADQFQRVYASDPSAAQIAQCPAHPRIQFASEPAEQCSLAANSVDAVCVAQAYHWLDLSRFLPEVTRVGREGTLFCLLSYGLCRVDPAVDAVYDQLYEAILGRYWPAERIHVENAYADLAKPGLPIADTPSFSMQPRWRLADYLGYLGSWSACQRYLQAEGRHPLSLVEAQLSAAWGDPQQTRRVNFPLRVFASRL